MTSAVRQLRAPSISQTQPGEGRNQRRHDIERRQGEHRQRAQRQRQQTLGASRGRAGHARRQPPKPRPRTRAQSADIAKRGDGAGAHDQRDRAPAAPPLSGPEPWRRGVARGERAPA